MGSASAPPPCTQLGRSLSSWPHFGDAAGEVGRKKAKKSNFHPISTKFPPNFHLWPAPGSCAHPKIPHLRAPTRLPPRPAPPKKYKTSEHEGKPSPGLAPLQAGLAAWVFCFFFACLEQRCMKKGGEAAPRRARGFWEKPSPPPVPAPPGEAPKRPPKGAACWDGDLFF